MLIGCGFILCWSCHEIIEMIHAVDFGGWFYHFIGASSFHVLVLLPLVLVFLVLFLLVLLLVVVFLFLFFFLLLLLFFFWRCCAGCIWFYHFTVVLVFSNSCINPLIYAAKYREFQRGVRRLIAHITGKPLEVQQQVDSYSLSAVSARVSSQRQSNQRQDNPEN